MRRAWAASAIVVLTLVPAARLAWLSRDLPHLCFFNDDGLYWVTAKSIAEGGGYRTPSLPGDPYQTKYPPVFPALLSLAWLITPQFPASVRTAVWITWLAVPILVWMANRLLATWGIPAVDRTVVCAVIGANAYVAFLGTVMLSELWATCFLLAALLLTAPSGVKWWRAPLAGLFAAAAYLSKTMLVPALVVFPLALWWRRQRRAALAFLLAAFPPAAAWHLWAAVNRGPATDSTWLYYLDYLGHYRDDFSLTLVPTLVYQNLGAYFTAGGELLFFKLSMRPAGEYLARLLMLAALAGVIRWVRASRFVEYPLFIALQIPIMLVWNWPPNERFLVPVLPLLALGLWTEMSHLGWTALAAWRRPEVPQRVAAAIVGIVLCGTAAALLGRNISTIWRTLPALAESSRTAAAKAEPLYAWIRENTPAGATFFADRDATLYLFSGRQSTVIRWPARHNYTEDHAAILAEAAKLPEFARARGLEYLLLTPSDFELDPLPAEERRAAHGAVARERGFRTVHDSHAGTVIRVGPHER